MDSRAALDISSALNNIADTLWYTTILSLVLTAGLFSYAIYATVTLARILREMRESRR